MEAVMMAAAMSSLPTEPRSYVAARLRGPFGQMDGDLDKPVWANVPWSSDFRDIRGEDAPAESQPPPSCRTRFKAVWDGAYVYVGALLEYDGPQYGIEASFVERNAPIYKLDSDIELFVDGTHGSNACYRELELNALNTPWNLLLNRPYMDGGSEHSGRVAKPGDPAYWDVTAQRTAVRLVRGRLGDRSRPSAWSAEMAIAHNETLGHPPGLCGGGAGRDAQSARAPRVGDVWRINLSRVERRGETNWVWSPQREYAPLARAWRGVVDMHRPESWGALHFADADGRLPGGEPRVPDWPLRAAGAMLYYAQRAFLEKHSRYALAVADLEESGLVQKELLEHARVEVRPRGGDGGYILRLSRAGAWLTVRDDRLMEHGHGSAESG
jgi:hypothetical protein